MFSGNAIFYCTISFSFLKEKITISVWVSIAIATIGIAIMAFGNSGEILLLDLCLVLHLQLGFLCFQYL
jgi:DME family drug/metabolite transporter